MKRLLFSVLYVGLIWLCPGLSAATEATVPAPPKGLIVLDGRVAPPLALKNAEGALTSLEALRGQWVLVHFWASWCGPCRREMPTLQQMSKVMDPGKLRLLLVNTAEDEDIIFTFLSVTSPELDSLLDPDGKVTELWQPRGLPSSFIVDPAGRLRYLALGGRDWSSKTYLSFLQQLVGQDPGQK